MSATPDILLLVMRLLPHGPEFCFVDRMLSLTPGKEGVGEYEGDGDGVGVGVSVTVKLRVGVAVKVALKVAVFVGVQLTVVVSDGVMVRESVGVEVNELVTETGSAAETLCQQYEAALREFHQQNFRQAAKILGSVLEEFPNDGPAVVLLSRVADRLVHPAGEFKPSWDLPGK